MTESRQRMLVMGKTADTVPKLKELAGEKLDVVSAADVRFPDASADFVVVDSSEPQMMSDIQVCAMGLLSALPDGIVLLDESLNILWHNSTFRQLLRTSEILVGQQRVVGLRQHETIDRIGCPRCIFHEWNRWAFDPTK